MITENERIDKIEEMIKIEKKRIKKLPHSSDASKFARASLSTLEIVKTVLEIC